MNVSNVSHLLLKQIDVAVNIIIKTKQVAFPRLLAAAACDVPAEASGPFNEDLG